MEGVIVRSLLQSQAPTALLFEWRRLYIVIARGVVVAPNNKEIIKRNAA